MASAETRDVVKQYELQANALLSILRPGGVLASLAVKDPCEALLVPRQISLEATDIVPFLQAKLQRPQGAQSPHLPAPPLSDLFGEGHGTPEQKRPQQRGTGGSGDAAAQADSSPSPSGLYYTAENEKAFRVALITFLKYHLLHFDGCGNSQFTTLRGQRGSFSDDLDHVKRFGHIGQVAVLADADPLLSPQQLQGSSSNDGKTTGDGNTSPGAAGQDREKTYFYPATLQIFIIDRPLMDSTEIRYVVDTLRKLTVRETTVAKVAARLNALFSNPSPSKTSLQPQPPCHPVNGDGRNLPFLMNVGSIPGRVGIAAVAATPTAIPTASHQAKEGTTSPTREARHSSPFLHDAAVSDDESTAETVIIDDFAEDVPEEPDLAPYVDKYNQISKQQRRRSENSQVPEEASSAVVAECATAMNTKNDSNNSAQPSAQEVTLPLPSAIDPNNNNYTNSSSGQATSAAQVTAQVVGTPRASPTNTTVTASRAVSQEGHSANNRGRVVAVTLATTSPKAATSPTAATHAGVPRREYSRECIKDYRRVVAADNEIYYNVFEKIMALRCSAPLARLMSTYVTKNQQLQQPILNNVKYNKFIVDCHTLVQQVPQFADNKRHLAILHEGIERYVTSRLYHQLYNVCEDERQQNAVLQAKFVRLENITAEQLDALPEVERHHVWGQAMFELDGMDFFKSPREKLRCGMRSCELLSLAVGDILRQRCNAKNAKNAATAALPAAQSPHRTPLAFGADEFLPCFLLLVLRARPLNYVQNICYIEKFRYPSLLSPNESYCFATLQSALMFWLNCGDDGRMEAAPAPAPAKTPSTPLPPQTAASNLANTAVPSTLAVAPPPMTEHDLLPSVRQASCTARAQEAATATGTEAQDGVVLSGNTVVAQPESPTVLDVLFGWANRSSASFVDGIGLGSASRKAAGSSSRSPSAPKPGSAAVTQFHAGRDVTMLPSPTDHLPAPSSVKQPDANRRALVKELLVTQHKTFEQLTLIEIQMIVEEARQLLTERK